MSPQNTTKFKRIMVKIGGESMLGNRKYGIDPQAARDVAKKIQKIYLKHIQVAIVIGGGNIFRGLAASKNGIERATADYMGMLATVMNGLALQEAIENLGVPARLQSALSMPQVAETYIRKKAIRHLEKGRVVILSAGIGDPYVTTDTGAALHALEIKCDVLMKATKVNGVFDQDPLLHKNARRYQTLNYKDAIEMDSIQIMDTAALAMCRENNMPLLVFKLFEGDNLERAVAGEDIGTYVSNQDKSKFA